MLVVMQSDADQEQIDLVAVAKRQLDLPVLV